ncbi:glycosyltransferase family 2 protein [Gluconobacter cerinus]|uniref:glycosyltransferase family 2 protein n=1 Tax=Gluconobacter cerinus TaxID=38307 RepID=UPI001B8D2CEB|nr:glycosyltransferase family 2 protein [Gluconobacter cerinus]MBS0983099.1 glycosyltransferase family 2 protein [Gluconobacter cerinus]
MKIAICSAIYNEEKDLPYWLAWHAAAGVDTFILYDDRSQDSTRDVLEALSTTYDIRLHTTKNYPGFHLRRQIDAFQSCIDKYKNEFDWISFIDSDEYIDTYGVDLKEFLLKYSEVSSIAMNWCCFGRDGHIIRPQGLPTINYKTHGDNDAWMHIHAKVIVDPKKVSGPIYQVHNILVDGPTIDMAGRPIDWATEHGGITRTTPDWQGGRLLHIQARSLEELCGRVRRAEKKFDSIHFDINSEVYNAVENQTDNNFINKVNRKIDQSVPKIFAWIYEKISFPSYDEMNTLRKFFSSNENKNKNVGFTSGYIKTHFGNYLFLDEKKCVSSKKENDNSLKYIRVSGSNIIHFYSPTWEWIKFPDDCRHGNIFSYKLHENDNKFYLERVNSRHFLVSEPNGNIFGNRSEVSSWEEFSFEPSAPSFLDESIASYLSLSNNIEKWQKNFTTPDVSLTIASAAFYELPLGDQNLVRFLCKNAIPEYIF